MRTGRKPVISAIRKSRESCSANTETETQSKRRRAAEREHAVAATPVICDTKKLSKFSMFSVAGICRSRLLTNAGPLTVLQVVLASLFLCLVALPSFAGTLNGTVRNGTTNEPATGVDIILFRLQGGMEVAATTKTDSQGRYSLQDPAQGQAPMLLRATYKGVNYHQPVTPGKTSVDVTVYEPTENLDAFSVADRAIILQPSSSGLSVGEIYDIENKTQPPKAYFRQNGSFEFSLPEGAQVSEVSASDASGMPVKQGTIDKGKNLEAIDYPFRPGESGVRISYNMPYSGAANLKFVSPYTTGRFAVFAPPGVQVTGDGLSAAGQEQGFTAYVRDAVSANTPVSVSISGTAPISTSNGSNGGAAGGMGADQSADANANSRLDQGDGTAPSASVTTLPPRLDSVKWVLAGGFAAIFALGFVFLWKRPQFITASAQAVPASGDSPDSMNGAAAGRTHSLNPMIGGASGGVTPRGQTPAAAVPTSVAVEEVNRQVAGSLDELKDKLFRLELRKQAGTVSDDDYSRERQRIEQLLRELVRG